MARRDFRQLGLADSIVRRRGKKSEWLDRLDTVLDSIGALWVKPSGYAGQAVVPLAGSVLLSEVDPAAAS
jgi:hypothetical protein